VATRRLLENSVQSVHAGTVQLRDCNEVPTLDD